MPYLNIVWRIIIMRKRISSIVLTVVMILGCFITDMDANINTVNADPYNIEISVETKEIGIEEIPENRRVPLAVNLSNVPDEDIYFMDISYKLDDKLVNWNYHCGERDHLPNISAKVGHMDNNTYYIKADTYYYEDKKIPNGIFYNIYVYIPPEVNEGDFYEISPIAYCYADSYQLNTSFALEANKEEIFGPSNFTFHSGGVKIRSSQQEQPIQSNPTPPENNINSDQHNIDSVTQPQTITELIASTEETTSLTSLTSLTSTTPVTFPPKVTASSASTTINTISETSTEITTTIDIDKEDNKTNILIILFIILLIFIITITLIIRKRKKK